MRFLVLSAVMVLSSIAHADGFLCETQSGLNVKVFNQVQPEKGTRVPAVLIVSDASMKGGEKTIGRFDQADAQLLVDEDGAYLAKVNLRDQARTQGLSLEGTRLENIDALKLYVDFTYDRPVADGAQLTGTVTLLNHDHGLAFEQAICTRYLKN